MSWAWFTTRPCKVNCLSSQARLFRCSWRLGWIVGIVGPWSSHCSYIFDLDIAPIYSISPCQSKRSWQISWGFRVLSTYLIWGFALGVEPLLILPHLPSPISLVLCLFMCQLMVRLIFGKNFKVLKSLPPTCLIKSLGVPSLLFNAGLALPLLMISSVDSSCVPWS